MLQGLPHCLLFLPFSFFTYSTFGASDPLGRIYDPDVGNRDFDIDQFFANSSNTPLIVSTPMNNPPEVRAYQALEAHLRTLASVFPLGGYYENILLASALIARLTHSGILHLSRSQPGRDAIVTRALRLLVSDCRVMERTLPAFLDDDAELFDYARQFIESNNDRVLRIVRDAKFCEDLRRLDHAVNQFSQLPLIGTPTDKQTVSMRRLRTITDPLHRFGNIYTLQVALYFMLTGSLVSEVPAGLNLPSDEYNLLAAIKQCVAESDCPHIITNNVLDVADSLDYVYILMLYGAHLEI